MLFDQTKLRDKNKIQTEEIILMKWKLKYLKLKIY